MALQNLKANHQVVALVTPTTVILTPILCSLLDTFQFPKVQAILIFNPIQLINQT
jgi:hypothetical protein